MPVRERLARAVPSARQVGRLTPDEVVGELRDGMTIGIGGWASRRKPMALVRAILRSPLRGLTVVFYAGPDVGLLIASGQATPLTELLGVRYPIVQSAMGYVSGQLVTAVSNEGGLGILASATTSLAELRSAIKETAAGTNGPFGVNMRADAPDAGERVAAVVSAGVPVASFALAPKPELIAALKDAGVLTIASAGERRDAEKVAAWGVDAVIAIGGEGGGHTGAVPTSLLIP